MKKIFIILLCLISFNTYAEETWTRRPTPVLVPSQSWEYTPTSIYGSVLEPSVIYDKNSGVYTMWYSGGWEKCSTGVATSIDGITWTKNQNNPIIGQGKMGFSIACRNSVIKDPVSGEVYVYFSNSIGSGGSLWVTHSADGVNNLSAPTLVLSPGSVDLTLANSWMVYKNNTWNFFYEALTSSGIWQVFLAKCSTLSGPCVKQTGILTGIQVGTGSYGGGWGAVVGGTTHTYAHSGPSGHLPSYIYHTCDNGLFLPKEVANGGNPVMTLATGNNFDQAADPFLIDGATMPDGISRMWFDDDINAAAYAQISLATNPNTLANIPCP